jgi:hypothetical protein
VKPQTGSYEAAFIKAAGTVPFPIELEGACGDAGRLLAECFAGLAAPGEPHPAKPIPHAPAQLDLARAGPNCPRLQIEQNHTGARAVRNAKELRRAVTDPQAAGLDRQDDPVPTLFPGLVILEALVRQAGQAEAGIGDADLRGLVGHDLGCDIDEPLVLRLDHLSCLFTAMDEYEATGAMVRLLLNAHASGSNCHPCVTEAVQPRHGQRGDHSPS